MFHRYRMVGKTLRLTDRGYLFPELMHSVPRESFSLLERQKTVRAAKRMLKHVSFGE